MKHVPQIKVSVYCKNLIQDLKILKVSLSYFNFNFQERIANPRKGDNLEGVVQLIQQTGCFAVDSESVNFDLCLLDKRTVKKITKFLGINVK